MAGARPLETLRMTTGIALGTLLLTGAILLTPVMNACAARDESISSCLRETLVSRQLLPPRAPPALEVVEQVLIEAPPSIEVAPEPGDLAVMAPSAQSSAPVSAPLGTSGQLDVVTTNEPLPAPVTNAELATSTGTVSVMVLSEPLLETTATLQAGSGTFALPSIADGVEDIRATDLVGEQGALAATGTIGPANPLVTATLATPALALATTELSDAPLPPMPAPLAGSAGAFATSRATPEAAVPAFAELSPLVVGELPPPPRPREEPLADDEDEQVIDETPVEPLPEAPADDPQFPSVTLLPPPLSGQNSSIVTLTLEF